MTVPGPEDRAVLGLAGPYTVTVDFVQTISGLAINNPDAVLAIPGGRQLRVGADGIYNDGWIVVNETSAAAATTILFEFPTELDGSGMLTLNAFSARARITSNVSFLSPLIHNADHTINGFGLINLTLDNRGRIVADVAGEKLTLFGATFTNSGVMSAINSGLLELRLAAIDQSAGGVLEADGGTIIFDAVTVSGGVIRNNGSSGSALTFHSSTLNDVEIDGDSVLTPGRQLTLNGGQLANNGLMEVNPTNGAAVTTLFANGSVLIDGSGEIALVGESTWTRVLNGSADLLTLGSGQTLSGIGQIAAATQIDGTLAPGLGVGTMTGIRPVSLGDSAVFACEFNDAGASDRYETSSTIALDGTLNISFVDGYAASTPEAFTIITTGANGVTGRFDQITGDAPPAPLITRVLYESNQVRVGFTCIGDADLDGSTDLDDLNAILTNFGSGASLGDLNADGIVDLDDLNIVLTNFGSACP